MVYENLATLFHGLAILFAIATLIITVKNREFERGEVENTVNALLFGFFILLIALAIRFLESLDAWRHNALVIAIPNIAAYIYYLTQIETLALAPLLAVCFLVAIFLARDIVTK